MDAFYGFARGHVNLGHVLNLGLGKKETFWVILFTGFENRGLMLRDLVIDVSQSSVSGIFRSGPSGTLPLQ